VRRVVKTIWTCVLLAWINMWPAVSSAEPLVGMHRVEDSLRCDCLVSSHRIVCCSPRSAVVDVQSTATPTISPRDGKFAPRLSTHIPAFYICPLYQSRPSAPINVRVFSYMVSANGWGLRLRLLRLGLLKFVLGLGVRIEVKVRVRGYGKIIKVRVSDRSYGI